MQPGQRDSQPLCIAPGVGLTFQGDEVSFGDVTLSVEAVERLTIRRVSIRFPADVGPVTETPDEPLPY